MFTPEQLAQLKALNASLVATTEPEQVMQEAIAALIGDVEHLTAALTAKDHVLSQFADSTNWQEIDISGLGEVLIWRGDSPVTLANQALSEGKE